MCSNGADAHAHMRSALHWPTTEKQPTTDQALMGCTLRALVSFPAAQQSTSDQYKSTGGHSFWTEGRVRILARDGSSVVGRHPNSTSQSMGTQGNWVTLRKASLQRRRACKTVQLKTFTLPHLPPLMQSAVDCNCSWCSGTGWSQLGECGSGQSRGGVIQF